MGKRTNARHTGQVSSTNNNHHRSRSRSPEPPDPELILPGLTRDQWSLLLDRRHRAAAYRLALKVPDSAANIDALLHSAEEALVEAVSSYDPGCDVPFTAYARRRMRRAMHERARDQEVPERLLRWRQDLIWMVVLREKH